MSVRAMLDDAAAEATAGLKIDLAAAQRQAAAHRARTRRRASAAMASALAVAAVVALIAVLLPGGVFRAVAPAPASSGKPTGLPDRWFYAPPWTPPVTRHPMAAASMVLSTPLSVGDGWTVDGPVVVSADGTQYASLPWSRWDSLVALSASGRDVGWVSQPNGTAGGPKRAVVHRIRLSDGRQWQLELPSGVSVQQLDWTEGSLYYHGQKDRKNGYLGPAFSDGSAPSGRNITVPAALTPSATPVPGGPIASAFTVLDPTRTRSAELVGGVDAGKSKISSSGYSVRITGAPEVIGVKATTRRNDVLIPITGSDPITEVVILGWADGGIVVRVNSRDPQYGNRSISLRVLDPQGGGSRIISRKTGTNAYPVAVAVDVVAAGKTVVGRTPTFSATDRRHIAFLWYRARREGGLSLYVAVVALLAGAGAVPFALHRRRRSRPSPPAPGV